VIDNGPLSTLGNEISLAHFVGLRNQRQRRGREIDGKKKLQRDYTVGTNRQTHRAEIDRENAGELFAGNKE